MRPCAWLLAGGLLALAACSESGWVQPGVTEEQRTTDTAECAEIARREAKRDRWFKRSYMATRSTRYRRGSGYGGYGNARPTLTELEFRYRYDCMADRGYDLVPLDDEPG